MPAPFFMMIFLTAMLQGRRFFLWRRNMPFDSEGNFTRVHNWEEDRQNNLDIMSDRMDEEDDNFAKGFNDTMLRDGRSTMTGNLKMGNFQVKNMAKGTVSTDAVNRAQLDELQTNTEKAIDDLAAKFQYVEELPEEPDSETYYFLPEK